MDSVNYKSKASCWGAQNSKEWRDSRGVQDIGMNILSNYDTYVIDFKHVGGLAILYRNRHSGANGPTYSRDKWSGAGR
jgi:hypothetical protein